MFLHTYTVDHFSNRVLAGKLFAMSRNLRTTSQNLRIFSFLKLLTKRKHMSLLREIAQHECIFERKSLNKFKFLTFIEGLPQEIHTLLTIFEGPFSTKTSSYSCQQPHSNILQNLRTTSQNLRSFFSEAHPSNKVRNSYFLREIPHHERIFEEKSLNMYNFLMFVEGFPQEIHDILRDFPQHRQDPTVLDRNLVQPSYRTWGRLYRISFFLREIPKHILGAYYFCRSSLKCLLELVFLEVTPWARMYILMD